MGFFERIRQWFKPAQGPVLILSHRHGATEEFSNPGIQAKLEKIKKAIDEHGGVGKSIALEGLTGAKNEENAIALENAPLDVKERPHPIVIAGKKYAEQRGMTVIPLEGVYEAKYFSLIRNQADEALKRGDKSLERKRAHALFILRERYFQRVLSRHKVDLILTSAYHDDAINEVINPSKTIHIGTWLERFKHYFEKRKLRKIRNTFKEKPRKS